MAMSLAPPSKKVSRFTAASTPKGMPIIRVMTMPARPSRSEFITLGAIKSITGRLDFMESPKSNWTALLMNFQYCMGQGWSRP